MRSWHLFDLDISISIISCCNVEEEENKKLLPFVFGENQSTLRKMIRLLIFNLFVKLSTLSMSMDL